MRSALSVGRTGRLGVAGIGLVAMASITVACSSSTSGNPSGGTTNGGVTMPPSTTASLPTMSFSASVPQLSGSKFCTDAGKVAQIGSALSGGNMNSLNKVVKSIDALAAEAPSEVKGDLQTMSSELHKALSGNLDKNLITKLTTAGQHIQQYLATHCKSS